MKKTNVMVLITLCLIICFAISGCSNNAVGTKPTESITQGEKDGESMADAPNIMTFDSVTDIVDFVSAGNYQESHFSYYAEEHSISKNVSYDVARNFAKNYSKTKIFCNRSDIVCDSFSGTYYVERNELSLIYKINGIIYRFIYTFDTNVPHQYDGNPVLQNVMVGSMPLDLYQGDGRLVGSIMDGETAIRIVVYTEQISDINFETFTIINTLSNCQTE